jgi:hypothetical protein
MDRSVKTLACGRAGICQFCGEHFSLVQRFLSGAIQIPTEGGVIGMKPEAVWIEFGFGVCRARACSRPSEKRAATTKVAPFHEKACQEANDVA